MTLKVAPKANVAGISEKLTFHTGEPVQFIQKVDPIPCGQILQPPINVPTELLIQLNSVMEVSSLCGCFGHMMEEGSTRSTNTAHKVKFAYQDRMDHLVANQ